MYTILWLIVLIVAIIFEAITVDLVSIWFGLGALVALILDLLNVSFGIQIAVFTVITVVSLVVTRPMAKKYLKTNVVATNSDRYIGKHALVTKSISPDKKGEVSVMSSIWSASSIDNTTIEKDDYCEVVAIEGAHLVVRKLSKESEE